MAMTTKASQPLLRALRACTRSTAAHSQQRLFMSAAATLQHALKLTSSARNAPLARALPVCGAVGSASFYSSDATSAGAEGIVIGDRVYLQMHGKLSNGEKFGATEQDRPLSFIVGSGDVIIGIDEAVIGLQKGVKKSVEIEPAKAFGVEKEVHTVPRSQLNLSPEDEKQLAVGVGLQLQNGQQARIVKVTDESIDIDLAHPYAGETLFLEIEIVDHIARAQLSSEERIVLPEELSPGDNTTFPSRGDTLVMHYVGKLASNGNVFDSSRDRGQPFQFQIGVGQVIKGWDEGVMRMSKGQKAILNIPSAKGYGRAGAGGVIPPDADLIFEVELLDILKQ